MKQFFAFVMCGLLLPSLHAQPATDLEAYVQEFNNEVASRQQVLDRKGWTPSAGVDRDAPQSYAWFVVPSMGYQWNREGGAGDFEQCFEGMLSAGDMLNLSYGVMVGVVKQHGGYVRYRYSKTDDPWVEMRSHQVRLGGVALLEKHVYAYAGLGLEFYKYTNEYTRKKVTDGEPWKAVSEYHNWAAVEAGLMGRWNRFLLSAGMSYSFSRSVFGGPGAGPDIGFDLGVGWVVK